MDIMLAGVDFAISYLDDVPKKAKPDGNIQKIQQLFQRITVYWFNLSEEK